MWDLSEFLNENNSLPAYTYLCLFVAALEEVCYVARIRAIAWERALYPSVSGVPKFTRVIPPADQPKSKPKPKQQQQQKYL